uniref:Uncharacterized protein n=1 Tax=Setaria italica TaxID=4555 RepID=K3YFH5_SETIT
MCKHTCLLCWKTELCAIHATEGHSAGLEDLQREGLRSPRQLGY